MPRSRSDRVGIGFMVLWLVFWTAAIIVAIWHMGGAAWRGEGMAAIFLVVWVAGAGFGLWTGARRLKGLLLDGRTPRRPVRDHRWEDGIAPPVPEDAEAITPQRPR